MTPHTSHAARFRALHGPGSLLLLPNVWDAASARAAEESGAAALGTSSCALAWAQGLPDGEHVPLETVIANARSIVRAVHIPVSVDFESGYSEDPATVARSAVALAEVGVAGINLEDRDAPAEVLAAKLSACREALARAGHDLFLNARIDRVLHGPGAASDVTDELVLRAKRYAEAGCDGIFVPGLTHVPGIVALRDAVGLPLNLWPGPGLPPLAELPKLGVRRISVGAKLVMAALEAVRREVRSLLQADGPVPPPLTYPQVNGWFVQR